jgi:hypothetical protein
MSSRRSSLQSTACGGLLHLLFLLLATQCVRLNTIGHVIKFKYFLYVFGTIFGIH